MCHYHCVRRKISPQTEKHVLRMSLFLVDGLNMFWALWGKRELESYWTTLWISRNVESSSSWYYLMAFRKKWVNNGKLNVRNENLKAWLDTENYDGKEGGMTKRSS
ncbi:unnamed protein product [Sphenostylis stenocarpa]|uniref:Uncharacterized protein n=1 Tax=Sphenostylis stenocarpa TaxID=92480 RepID=A0AA86V788_9FABA|nr:unnamed protein product [Sphenostylis stenocarpa]